MTASDPPFYGWRIVGLTFVAQFLSMGMFFYTFGVFLKPLTDALDTDRFNVALALRSAVLLRRGENAPARPSISSSCRRRISAIRFLPGLNIGSSMAIGSMVRRKR